MASSTGEFDAGLLSNVLAEEKTKTKEIVRKKRKKTKQTPKKAPRLSSGVTKKKPSKHGPFNVKSLQSSDKKAPSQTAVVWLLQKLYSTSKRDSKYDLAQLQYSLHPELRTGPPIFFVRPKKRLKDVRNYVC